MVTLVSTIGFDEKFAIRAIIRHISEISRCVFITATDSDPRVSKAISNINHFIDSYLANTDKKIERQLIEVDVREPYNAISVLRREIFEKFGGTYILNTSGGMRALVVVTLASFIISGARGVIETELENFLGTITINPEIFHIGILSDNKASIVRAIAEHENERVTYRDIINKLRIPRATLFRELKQLKSMGLIRVERVGTESHYYLTDLGRAYR